MLRKRNIGIKTTFENCKDSGFYFWSFGESCVNRGDDLNGKKFSEFAKIIGKFVLRFLF